MLHSISFLIIVFQCYSPIKLSNQCLTPACITENQWWWYIINTWSLDDIVLNYSSLDFLLSQIHHFHLRFHFRNYWTVALVAVTVISLKFSTCSFSESRWLRTSYEFWVWKQMQSLCFSISSMHTIFIKMAIEMFVDFSEGSNTDPNEKNKDKYKQTWKKDAGLPLPVIRFLQLCNYVIH